MAVKTKTMSLRLSNAIASFSQVRTSHALSFESYLVESAGLAHSWLVVDSGSTMPPDLRTAAPGDIDSSMLQTSTNRLLLQSWLPDGGHTHTLAQKTPAHGIPFAPWQQVLRNNPLSASFLPLLPLYPTTDKLGSSRWAEHDFLLKMSMLLPFSFSVICCIVMSRRRDSFEIPTPGYHRPFMSQSI